MGAKGKLWQYAHSINNSGLPIITKAVLVVVSRVKVKLCCCHFAHLYSGGLWCYHNSAAGPLEQQFGCTSGTGKATI